MKMFPSPHSGILFLCKPYAMEMKLKDVEFPSPHSGILFLSVWRNGFLKSGGKRVSVPSFGDSFFIIIILL